MDTPDELLARILEAATRIKEREDRLRRTTRDLPTRVKRCTEAVGGALITFVVFCSKFAISV